MQAGSADDFVGKISRALEGAGRKGNHVTAGAGSCDLEAQQFGMFPPEEEQTPVGRPHHLESPVGPRDLGGHDAHVTIGVIWLVTLLFISLRGGIKAEDSLDVEIAGLYWHFVDIVWVAIFTIIYLIP